MKRYVLEIMREIMRANDPQVRTGELRHPYADDILKVTRCCGRGMLTSMEAVRSMVELDVKAKGMSWRVPSQQEGGAAR